MSAIFNPTMPGTSSPTTTGTQTALAIPSGPGPLTLFLDNASLLTIQGIAAGIDGQELTLYSIGAGQVDLHHQHASASAANRLVNIATSYQTSLSAGSGVATYRYDAASSRWRLKEHDQGAPIDYSGTSTFVGWSAYTTKHLRYFLKGRNLRFFFAINGTSNSTTTSFTLPFTATAAAADGSADFVNSFTRDNGVTISQPTRSQFADSVTVQSFTDMGTTGWTAANQKIVRGTSEVDID